MNEKQIKTRIAPSPTGMLHIGTVRTALFNYLFAKKNNGKFIIRVEDTDDKRSTSEYEKDILDGLKWLGLNHDEEITHQKDRLDIYKNYTDKLIEIGAAYEKDGAIWFRLESYKKSYIEFKDLIQGKIRFEKEAFNDFPIVKSNGIPLYQFANVVDDHQMEITHVIRGADHINSTPQQIMMYEVLGLELPQFGHMPLILNADKTKMSKRKNPVSITKDFWDKGYLPEAMINYMALLGWNPKNDREVFNLEELEKEFKIENVNKSPAIFDTKKLNFFNNYYIHEMDSNDLLDKINRIEPVGDKNKNINSNLIIRAVEITKGRMETLLDFETLSDFIFDLPEYKRKMLVFKKSDLEKTTRGLRLALEKLRTLEDWNNVKIINDTILEIVNENKDLNPGDVFWPVRVAVSGLERSPSPPEILWALGKEESIKRIELAIKKLKDA